jgi:hypothetical protein
MRRRILAALLSCAVLSTDNAELLLRPGMTATAEIAVQHIEQALLIRLLSGPARGQPRSDRGPAAGVADQMRA